MSQLPADRGRLLAIRAYLQLQLRAVEAALARLDAAEKRGRQSPGDPGPAGDPPRGEGVPWWRLQLRGGGERALLHRGDCRIAAGHHVDRVTARLALTGPTIRARACPRCRPDLDLT